MASLRLPLSSLIASSSPSHPLPRLLLDPLFPRLAAFEAALLLSRPSALLLRLGLASERGLVACALALLVAGLARWRAQWRAILWALGVGEALKRTVEVLRRESGSGAGRKRSGEGSEGEQQRPEDHDDEVQHILSFWVLFALVSLLERLRTTPSSTSSSSAFSTLFALPSHLRSTLRTLRHTYLRFLRLYVLPSLLRARYSARQLVERYPRLDPAAAFAKLPYFPILPSSILLQRRASSAPRVRGSFPQPRQHGVSLSSPSLPPAWSYFSSSSPLSSSEAAEKKWELVKLLLLWTGLRRDGFGAKGILWDGVLKPFFGAESSGAVEFRAVRSGGKKADEAEGTWRRNVDRPKPRPETAQDDPSSPQSSSSAAHFPSTSISFSATSTSATPYSLDWTPHRPVPSGSISTATTPRRYARSPSPTPSSAPFAFPTPTVSSTAQQRRLSRPTTVQHPLIPLSLSLPASTRTASPASSSSTTHGRACTAPPSSSAAFQSSSFRRRPLSSSLPQGSSSSRTGMGAGDGQAKREKRASLLFESPPRAPVHSNGRRGSSSSSSSAAELPMTNGRNIDADEEGGSEWASEAAGSTSEVPQTPGEEEAEEGQRGWGVVLSRQSSSLGD
ncbi:hypothetical protein JCM8547_000889 [Rhodosporidiobolus lusitaniae]